MKTAIHPPLIFSCHHPTVAGSVEQVNCRMEVLYYIYIYIYIEKPTVWYCWIRYFAELYHIYIYDIYRTDSKHRGCPREDSLPAFFLLNAGVEVDIFLFAHTVAAVHQIRIIRRSQGSAVDGRRLRTLLVRITRERYYQSMSYARLGYTTTASYFHWIVAFPLIGCVATVLKAQQVPKTERGDWMWRHKSLGLLTAMLVTPRVAYRLLSRDSYNVASLVGNSSVENTLGKISHYALYGFMIVMPTTGIAMGYFGGKGLPFFTTLIPGAVTTDDNAKKLNGQIAKQVRSCFFFSLITMAACTKQGRFVLTLSFTYKL